MTALRFRRHSLLSLTCVGLITAATLGGCSTFDPNVIARGQPCATLGQITYGDNHNTPLVCNEAPTGNAQSVDAKGVWGVLGLDKPIVTKATPNTHCPEIGALAVADDDGTVMRCVWNTPDLMPKNGASHDQ